MGKPKKVHRQPRFQYNRNRSREWKKTKKLPTIECEQIRKAWNPKRPLNYNMKAMGLSMNPNVTLKIPTVKELIMGEAKKEEGKQKVVQSTVIAELEAEASIDQAKTLQLSEPEIRYCVYMLEKYGDDYKAMAKDRRNYYQDTPKQIKRKIKSFKNTPAQYDAYLKLKGENKLGEL